MNKMMTDSSENKPAEIHWENAAARISHAVHSRSVGMDELFYDLVYAYAISSLTDVLESASGSGFSLIRAAVYLILFIVLVNSWMYQMVYTNRYGQSGFADGVLTYSQAALLLYLSSSLQSSLMEIFVPFTSALAGLSLLLFLEYLLAWHRNQDPADRRLIRSFLLMTGIRTFLIGLGVFFPVQIGLWISLAGILIGWVLPIFFHKQMRERPVDFSHLSERLSLLVILMFGEMILSLAFWFSPKNFGWPGLISFVISVLLFQSYSLIYRHIHEAVSGTFTGVHAIYLHYLILIGLNLTASAFEKLPELHDSLFPTAGMLFTGLLLFFAGLYGCLIYLQCHFQKSAVRICLAAGTVLIFWMSAFSAADMSLVLICALACTALEYGILVSGFRRKQGQKKYS